jgi:hypothetical protein
VIRYALNRNGELVARSKKDPTEPIRERASRYPEVDKGTACTQSSFKTGKKAFLYVGMQGGRYKAMFKLRESMDEASRLARTEPDRYQLGSTPWVTARFTAEEPMPARRWKKWLDESYALSRPTGVASNTGKKATATKKTTPRAKMTGKKATSERTSTKKASTNKTVRKSR